MEMTGLAHGLAHVGGTRVRAWEIARLPSRDGRVDQSLGERLERTFPDRGWREGQERFSCITHIDRAND